MDWPGGGGWGCWGVCVFAVGSVCDVPRSDDDGAVLCATAVPQIAAARKVATARKFFIDSLLRIGFLSDSARVNRSCADTTAGTHYCRCNFPQGGRPEIIRAPTARDQDCIEVSCKHVSSRHGRLDYGLPQVWPVRQIKAPTSFAKRRLKPRLPSDRTRKPWPKASKRASLPSPKLRSI